MKKRLSKRQKSRLAFNLYFGEVEKEERRFKRSGVLHDGNSRALMQRLKSLITHWIREAASFEALELRHAKQKRYELALNFSARKTCCMICANDLKNCLNEPNKNKLPVVKWGSTSAKLLSSSGHVLLNNK